MAIKRVFLGAHQGDSKLRDAPAQAGKAFLELWQCGYSVINGPVPLIAFSFDSPRSQFFPKKNVPDAGSFQRGGELLAVELFQSSAIRMRTHISENVHAVLP